MRYSSRCLEDINKDAQDKLLEEYSELLFGYGLLAEGSALEDPVRFNKLVVDLILRTM